MKAVQQLPQEPKWRPPRRVCYGKDRCAYVSKTQQQNAAQYLGIAPGYAYNGADGDVISNALVQQAVAAAAVATSAGGINNLGNRTVYIGNIHPETTIEEICNVVRGGLLHHIRYIPDKHICLVTFVDPTSAASFYALSNIQGLMIHNRRLKIGWGKHSGALPPAIALAVSGGASRNVYIGNLNETWTEDRLRQALSEYGEIELIQTLHEKSCAFVNFTNIANAIKAIEAVRGREEYKRFKVNFGKNRCGNPPRQVNASSLPATAASIFTSDVNNPLMMYLSQLQQNPQNHYGQQPSQSISLPTLNQPNPGSGKLGGANGEARKRIDGRLEQTDISVSDSTSTRHSSTLWTGRETSTNPTSVLQSLGDLEQEIGRDSSSMTFYRYKDSAVEESVGKECDDLESIASVSDDIQSQADSSVSGLAKYRQAAVNYFVKTFTKDAELFALYQTATQSIRKDKFVRNHRRLLKQLFLNLNSDGWTRSQKLALGFLKSQSRRTHISSEIYHVFISPDDTIGQISLMIKDEKDNLSMLDRYLEELDTTAKLESSAIRAENGEQYKLYLGF